MIIAGDGLTETDYENLEVWNYQGEIVAPPGLPLTIHEHVYPI